MRGAWGMLVVLCGCTPVAVYSDGGAIEFRDVDVSTSTAPYAPRLEPITVDDKEYPRPPVLRGTAICPTEVAVRTEADVDGAALVDCFRTTGEGLADDGVCLNLNKSGEAAWVFTAKKDCELPDDVPETDRFTFDVIGPADVSARLDRWPEWVVSDPASGGGVVGEQDVWLPGPDDVTLVLADTAVGFDVELTTTGAPVLPVVYRLSDAVWTLDDGTVLPAEPWPVVSLAEGQEALLRLEVAGASFDVGRLRGVAADDVRKLAVSVGTFEGAPVGARAVGVTDDDQPVFGLPVTWKVVRGSAALQPKLYAGQDAYTAVSDACILPSKRGGKRVIGVEASWGKRRSAEVVRWDGTAGTDEEDAAWTAPETCEGGCGCATSGGAPGVGIASLGLLVVAARRRGRGAIHHTRLR